MEKGKGKFSLPFSTLSPIFSLLLHPPFIIIVSLLPSLVDIAIYRLVLWQYPSNHSYFTKMEVERCKIDNLFFSATGMKMKLFT